MTPFEGRKGLESCFFCSLFFLHFFHWASLDCCSPSSLPTKKNEHRLLVSLSLDRNGIPIQLIKDKKKKKKKKKKKNGRSDRRYTRANVERVLDPPGFGFERRAQREAFEMQNQNCLHAGTEIERVARFGGTFAKRHVRRTI